MGALRGPRAGRTYFTPAERLAQDIPGIVDQEAAADAIQALLDGAEPEAISFARTQPADDVVAVQLGPSRRR